MKKRKYYNNPMDLISETYNANDFKIVDKKANALVMPLDMVYDADALASSHFHQEEWDKEIEGLDKTSTVPRH